MPYAIELFFDPAADARIRGIWERLASPGRPSMAAAGSRPHVSLVVCDAVEVRAAEELLERFAVETERFPISFGRVGVFPGEGAVLYLAPDPDARLQEVQRVFSAGFGRIADGLWEHYQPEAWVPHCTLASGIGSSALAEMMERSRSFDLPMDAVVCEMGLVESRPVRLLGSFPLGRLH